MITRKMGQVIWIVKMTLRSPYDIEPDIIHVPQFEWFGEDEDEFGFRKDGDVLGFEAVITRKMRLKKQVI